MTTTPAIIPTVHIPLLNTKLSGKDTYLTWRYDAKIALRCYGAMGVVDGSEHLPTPLESHLASLQIKPASSTAEINAHRAVFETYQTITHKAKWARLFLLSNIEPEVLKRTPKGRDPAVLWKALEDMFNYKTIGTLHHALGNLFALQYDPSCSLRKHLASFSSLWSIVGLAADTDGSPSALQGMSRSMECKAVFLLLSLKHDSMADVVENLRAKNGLTYEYAFEKLMAICISRELSASKAVGQTTGSVSGGCSYCKKHGERYQGHVWQDCRKRRSAKRKERESGEIVALW